MYDVNKFEFYRTMCSRYPHYCDACEHEVFDMKEQIWICPYDRFGDAVSQISVLEAEFRHCEV